MLAVIMMVPLDSVSIKQNIKYKVKVVTFTNYYIVNDTFRWQVIIALLIWKEKAIEQIKLNVEIHLEFILHYITLTDYYIVNDTFRSRVITSLLIWEEKK